MTDVTRRVADFAGLDVPVIEVSSGAPGPRLSVISGVHGCEYASIAGVRRWVSGLAEDPGRLLRGSVTVVPVVNVPAFWARTPFVVPEDGKNLNRCFPGSPDGTLAERLAFAVFDQVITGGDAVVDVHAGDLVEALEPFVMYDGGPAEDFARGLAAAYGIRYVVPAGAGPGQTVAGSSSAASAGGASPRSPPRPAAPAWSTEAGGGGACSRARRRTPLLEMSPDGPAPTAPVYLDSLSGRARRSPAGRSLPCGPVRRSRRGRSSARCPLGRRHCARDVRRALRQLWSVRDQFPGCGGGRPAARPRRGVTRRRIVRRGGRCL